MNSFPNLTSQTGTVQEQTLRGVTDDLSVRRDFIDLRALSDDKTVLSNPHKGWFWHYIDNGMARGAYRDDIDINDELHDFPGLNHLYLRFDWGDVEREKGVYDFSYLDETMALWGARGYTFSLRVCTYEGSRDMNHATPAYVFEEGARCFDLPKGRLQPDYSDPIFLFYLEKFMSVLGEKYNGDPRVELIDIGTYGTWGEGHTVEGDSVIYPMEVVKKHFDLHSKYFPDTFILCNDDHLIGRMANGQSEVQEMLDYAASRGFGLQDDSICCDGYAQDCGYDTMRAPWAFERLSEYAPSCIEFAHYCYILPDRAENFRQGFTIIEALKNSRATFAGFHTYPRKWLAEQKYLTEYCANRLGYWYFLTGAVVPSLTPTSHNIITLDLCNRGWAKAYHRFSLFFIFKNDSGEYRVDVDFDNRLLTPDKSVSVPLRVDLRGVPSGSYDLYVGMADGPRPVRLALKESIYSGGAYKIAKAIIL